MEFRTLTRKTSQREYSLLFCRHVNKNLARFSFVFFVTFLVFINPRYTTERPMTMIFVFFFEAVENFSIEKTVWSVNFKLAMSVCVTVVRRAQREVRRERNKASGTGGDP